MEDGKTVDSEVYDKHYSHWLRTVWSGDRILVGRNFPPVQTGPGTHPGSCTMGTGSFPGVKYGRGVLLTTNSLLVPWSWKSRAIPLLTLWATTGPVTGTLYLFMITNILFAMLRMTHWRVELLHLCLTFDTVWNVCWAAHSPVVLFYCHTNLNWHWRDAVLANLQRLLPDL